MSGADGDRAAATAQVHAGRDPAGHAGAVSIPPYRASTILFPDLDSLEARDPDFQAVRYGRTGTPSSHAFEEAMAELEGGHRAVSFGSGLQAITTALLAVLKAGDHLLMADTTYGPTRAFCQGILARMGVETTFYDPLLGAAELEPLFKPHTRALFLESPGSLTFEVQDVAALAAVAKARGCTVLMDNTWAAGVYFKPLAHGVDISLQACTKYVAGHADANLGIAVCTAGTWRAVKHAAVDLGATAAADDLFLGLRGLRTLSLRLARHQETGLLLADWLAQQPEVRRVLHPARPDCPGHDLWKRDFTGASGLFTVELRPLPRPVLKALVEGLKYFGMGYSWGGFESLVLPTNPRRIRTARPWAGDGTLIRFHAGLEEPADLIRDLEAGFARLREALSA